MAYTVIINSQKIKDKIEAAVFNKVRVNARNLASVIVYKKKEKFLQEFIENPITQQILEGGKSNSGVDGQNGNLASFIGFSEGEEQTAIKDLYDYFNKNIYLKPSYKYDKGNKTFTFKMNYPKLEDIKDVTDLSKYITSHDDTGYSNGRSWAISIERGIPRLNKYKYSDDSKILGGESRSGFALQRKNTIHQGAQYKPKKYISELLKILIK